MAPVWVILPTYDEAENLETVVAAVRSQGYAFRVELTYRALRRGLRVEEVPIVSRARARTIEDVGADRARGGLARAGAAVRTARGLG